MGLFDKKNCDVCGGKIGLLGNRKLKDGNLCKDCAAKLSPLFSERKQSSVAEIKEQLAYREENKKAAAAFNAARTLGAGKKVLVDDTAGKFMVTSARKPAEENADVIDISQVTACELKIEESSGELYDRDSNDNEVSFNPPRYEHEFDFNMTIKVKSPWFEEIRLRLVNSDIVVETSGSDTAGKGGPELGRTSEEYRAAEALAAEIKSALKQA